MPKQPPDPDRLVRETAGRYRTADERFAVEQESASSWYLSDSEHTDELGLPLLRGPFATLQAARAAIAGARAAPAPKPRVRTPPAKRTKPEKVPPPPPEPEIPAWLARLSESERSAAERLVKALVVAGLAAAEAESLVRRELERDRPVIAPELLRRHLSARSSDGRVEPEDALRIVAGEGFEPGRGRPPRGWRLVELDERGRETGRRIEPD